MRFNVILHEAFRDVVNGTSRVTMMAAVFCLLAIPLAFVEVLTVAGILESAARFASSGGATRILTGSEAASISARGCEAVGADRRNVHSGGLRSARPLVFDELPDNRVLQFEISPSFLTVLGSKGSPRGGVWVSSQLAQTLQVGAGSRLHVQGRSVTIEGVFNYPDDGRDSRVAFAVLVPTAGLQNYDECWVFAWPVPPNVAEAMLIAVAPGKLGSVHEGRLNTNFGADFDGDALFRARPSVFACPLGAILGLTLGSASVWVRRLQIASNLHAGVSRPAMTLQIFIEALAWAVGGATISAGVIATLSTFVDGGDRPEVLSLAMAPIVMTGAATLLGSIGAALLVRERSFFRYFKAR